MKDNTLWNFNDQILESIMFYRVWLSARYKQWKTTLIFIKGLLEDEQGLSLGEMLTVNFRQPSHEFTFNVGIDILF
jgi:hypothetical protein